MFKSFSTYIHYAIIMMAMGTSPALAQMKADSPAFDAAYNAMLANPSDVDATTQYAEMAVAAGDYEAAIPPLERLLMNNPSSAKIRLELGVLYFMLNSKDVARDYLTLVANSEHAKPEYKAQAQEYLNRL